MNQNSKSSERTNDLVWVQEIKSLWTKYQHLPNVRAVFAQALLDGHMSLQELEVIKDSIRLELAHEYGGLQSLRLSSTPDSVLAEIEELIMIAPKGSTLDLMLGEAMQDGKVTAQELEAIRAEAQIQKWSSATGPSVTVRPPMAPQPMNPGRVKKKEDEDEED